jgi:hypothetical protein
MEDMEMDVQEAPMSESMGYNQKYIPKQFDLDALSNIDNERVRDWLFKMITTENHMFREEIRTTLESYGLIIDQREGVINRVLN